MKKAYFYVTTCKERKKEREGGVEGVINSGQIWLFDGVTLAKQVNEQVVILFYHYIHGFPITSNSLSEFIVNVCSSTPCLNTTTKFWVYICLILYNLLQSFITMFTYPFYHNHWYCKSGSLLLNCYYKFSFPFSC